MTACYIFDLDGTLSDPAHRLHHIQKEPKDWDAFFDASAGDAPIPHTIKLYRALAKDSEIIILSGRSDAVRVSTLAWLVNNVEPQRPFKLFMRKAGDHRPDDVVKSEMMDYVLSLGHEPIMVFDDRDRVVKMWRQRGIPCAQVADGDF